MMTFLLLLSVFCLAGPTESAIWDYKTNGPSQWVNLGFAKCGGQSQSPIDIQTGVAVEDVSMLSMGDHLSDLLTSMTPSEEVLRNTGHGLQVDITGGYIMNVWKNIFERSQYQLDQYHIHWAGDPSDGGSEHTIDSRQYFAEIHLVHHNVKYSDLATAVPKTDGLAVLGFFVEVQGNDNPAFQQLLDFINNDVEFNLAPRPITGLANGLLFNLLQPSISSTYYRYPGSLTTPSCDESVLWTVFKNTIKISPAQAATLTTAVRDSSGNPLNDIFRPVQDLNGRRVLRSQIQDNVYSVLLNPVIELLRKLIYILG